MLRELGFWMGTAAIAFALPGAAHAATAQSTFTSGADGWQVVGEAVGPIWEGSGGFPGGYISAASTSGGEVWYWRAPGKFRGNHSGAYGRTLSFAARAATFALGNKADVVIEGGGVTLVYDCHGPTMGSWTTYTLPLAESAGWSKQLGNKRVPATAMDFRVVLANVEELKIRGEGGAMMSNSDLDTVVLSEAADGPGTIPAGDALPVLMGATLLIGLVQVRKRAVGR